ncbi:MAG: nitroreductase [Clostridia bacterium]|nr:nitroreductase [Clostridia bacterium]
MDKMNLIRQRHSVRQYLDKRIEPEKITQIKEKIAEINAKSGLNIQLIESPENVFGGFINKLIGWSRVPCGIAICGKTAPDLEEKCGYFGEELVLFLQEIGLNTCWVGTFNEKNVKPKLDDGEKVVITIALGYGANGGSPHKSKTIEKVTNVSGDMPDWFKNGVEAALLAPTAINQQKFVISLSDNGIAEINTSGKGPYINVDLGIVKYHFDVGIGKIK